MTDPLDIYVTALSHIARTSGWLTDDPYERIEYLQSVAADALEAGGATVHSDPLAFISNPNPDELQRIDKESEDRHDD